MEIDIYLFKVKHLLEINHFYKYLNFFMKIIYFNVFKTLNPFTNIILQTIRH